MSMGRTVTWHDKCQNFLRSAVVGTNDMFIKLHTPVIQVIYCVFLNCLKDNETSISKMKLDTVVKKLYFHIDVFVQLN